MQFKNLLINDLNINEQNLLAKGFYKYIRFIIYKVVDNDEQ